MRLGATVLMWMLGCRTEPEPRPTEEPAPQVLPHLHRLTAVQVNQALASLFPMPDEVTLPQVTQPAPQRVFGFDNHAATRPMTAWAAELLQRDLASVASVAYEHREHWAACDPETEADPSACGGRLLHELARHAWRRPLTPAEGAWLTEHFESWVAQSSLQHAVELSIAMVLHAPQFHYLVEHGGPAVQGRVPLTDWEMASRLGVLLWDDLPDEELLLAAEAGQLQTAGEVRAQAERMLADPRARGSLARFVYQWLGVEDIDRAGWDLETFGLELDVPTRDHYDTWLEKGDLRALVEAQTRWQRENVEYRTLLAAELQQLLEHVLFDSEGTLSELLTTPLAYVNRQTVALYDPSFDRSTLAWELEPLDLSAKERPGVLTRGAFLAAHGHPTHASPVLRGVFLAERLLCRPPGLPPPTLPSLDEAAPAGTWVTNRQRYEVAVQDEPCASCHAAFDPLGYVFEHFDGMGRWRDVDQGEPVDATATVDALDVTGEVHGAAELVERLARSRRVHDCLTTQLFRYAMHRSESDDDVAALTELQASFWDGGGNIPGLFVELVASDAFRTMPDPAGGAE